MCPGRNFTKHETMNALAVILRMFEIDIVHPEEARKTKSDMTTFPFGSLGFDRKVPVRIRRRRTD